MNREEMMSRVLDRTEAWDMLVVGGGATGVGIAVDAASRGYDLLLVEQSDFGKGTSSLTCFQNYPVETVKIDRSFTANITNNHSHSVITQAIVDLAHDLDANIVAEGVESETQLELLKKWGCDAAQGFLISEPLDSKSLRTFMENPSQSHGISQIINPYSPPLILQNLPSTVSNQSLQNG